MSKLQATKKKSGITQGLYVSKKAPIQDIIKISHDMYDRSMKSKQKLEHKRKAKINPENHQVDLHCTFKPDTNKYKYNKFPQPSNYRQKVNLTIKPMTQTEQATKFVKKIDTVSKPSKRVEICYKWAGNRQNIHTSRFFQKQIHESKQKCSVVSRTNSKNSVSIILNKSLQMSTIQGTNSFLQRQQKARLMKQSKQFLLRNPTSHTWNFKQRINSSVDTLSSHYLDFGESGYSSRSRTQL